MPLPMEKKQFTYADCLMWDESERYEIIDGEAVKMESPSTAHQWVSAELCGQLYTYLRGKKCRAFAAPFDVRLFEKDGDLPEDVRTVVQPDISVICDLSKIDSHGCKGAPDLVIEILSPSTSRMDRFIKFDLYQRAGVREYWIVDPDTKTVQVHTLEEGHYYAPQVFTETVKAGVLEDCVIDLKDVFTE